MKQPETTRLAHLGVAIFFVVAIKSKKVVRIKRKKRVRNITQPEVWHPLLGSFVPIPSY